MIPIEENHEKLDIILGYKPDKYEKEYMEVNFVNQTPTTIEFVLTDPNGNEYFNLGTHQLGIPGTWTYKASATDYKTEIKTIFVTKARYGEYLVININLEESPTNKAYIHQNCMELVYHDWGWTLDYPSDDLFYIDRYKLIEPNAGTYTDYGSTPINEGYMGYYADLDSYFKNEYNRDGFMPVTYYYNTNGLNPNEVKPSLDTIPFIKGELLTENEHRLTFNFYNAVTGEPLEYDISGNPPDITGDSNGWGTYEKYGGYTSTDTFDTYSENNSITVIGRYYQYGYYTFKITAVGYVDYYYNGVLFTDTTYSDEGFYKRYQSVDIYLMPIEKANGFAAILTWGENPSDLDSHLLIYNNENNDLKAHISYQDETYYVDSKLAASLDVDDTSGFGPETTTVNIVEPNTNYYYYIHCYSPSSYGIPIGAKVEFYLDGNKIRTEEVYPYYSNTGNPDYLYWKVFSYNSTTRKFTFNGDNEYEVPSIVHNEPTIYNWEGGSNE